jgi:hypothetical protein
LSVDVPLIVIGCPPGIFCPVSGEVILTPFYPAFFWESQAERAVFVLKTALLIVPRKIIKPTNAGSSFLSIILVRESWRHDSI